MATKRKMRKVKFLKKSKSLRKSLGKFLKNKKSLKKSKSRSRSRKYRVRGGCENCTNYHGSGSPAPQWIQRAGSNEQMINNDIFKHSTDSSFYSSTK